MIEDNELRDFFAAFAMHTLMQKFREFNMSLDKIRIAEGSYEMADAMLEARKQEEPKETGIAAVKTRRKKSD